VIITVTILGGSFFFFNDCGISDEAKVINPLESPTWVPSPREREYFPHIQEPDEVVIGRDLISMPLGRILLVRKKGEYCVLKFINTWLSKTPFEISTTDIYTSYEFYYQDDGSGNFFNSNAKTVTGVLHSPKVSSFLGIPYIKGSKNRIRCGGIEIIWKFISTIYLENAEFAPTPWRSINEVNINDPRIEWHRKGGEFKSKRLPIDQLWKD
jgi:hypothetical protein